MSKAAKNIMHVIPALNFGGIETYIFNKLKHQKHNNKHIFLTLNKENNLAAERFKRIGVRVIESNSHYNLLRMLMFYKIARKYCIDECYFHINELSGLYAFCAPKTSKIHIHSHNYYARSSFTIWLKKTITRMFARLRPISKYACSQKAGSWLFGQKTEFIIDTPEGELENFKFDAVARKKIRNQLNVSNRKVILSVGRLEKQKNIVSVVQKFHDMADKSDRLLLIGTGSLEDQLLDHIIKLEISDQVIHIKSTDEVYNFMHAADAFVLNSLHEGFGIVGLEAWLTGLPVYLSEAFPNELTSLEGIGSFSEFCMPELSCDSCMRRELSLKRYAHWKSQKIDPFQNISLY